MTIGSEWVVFDTNFWIFGLCQQPEQPACAQVLEYLPRLYVKIPRQVLLELQANLRHEEMRAGEEHRGQVLNYHTICAFTILLTVV